MKIVQIVSVGTWITSSTFDLKLGMVVSICNPSGREAEREIPRNITVSLIGPASVGKGVLVSVNCDSQFPNKPSKGAFR